MHNYFVKVYITTVFCVIYTIEYYYNQLLLGSIHYTKDCCDMYCYGENCELLGYNKTIKYTRYMY
jgi:hypothetical protein